MNYEDKLAYVSLYTGKSRNTTSDFLVEKAAETGTEPEKTLDVLVRSIKHRVQQHKQTRQACE